MFSDFDDIFGGQSPKGGDFEVDFGDGLGLSSPISMPSAEPQKSDFEERRVSISSTGNDNRVADISFYNNLTMKDVLDNFLALDGQSKASRINSNKAITNNNVNKNKIIMKNKNRNKTIRIPNHRRVHGNISSVVFHPFLTVDSCDFSVDRIRSYVHGNRK